MLVVLRFRPSDPDGFRAAIEEAHALLAVQQGYVGGWVGRNVDDPDLWTLTTLWQGPGAYRRALGAYDVKARAWNLLGTAIEEPSAYEVVQPGEAVNDLRYRG